MKQFTPFQKQAIAILLAVICAVAAVFVEGEARVTLIAAATFCVGWVQKRPADLPKAAEEEEDPQ